MGRAVRHTGRGGVSRRLTQMAIVGVYLGICIAAVRLEQPPPPKVTRLDRILISGQVTVLTRNNANSYYIYRDRPMGFDYDLARAFADDLGVRLRLRICNSWESIVHQLSAGPADLAAANLIITPRRRAEVAFSHAYMHNREFIIAHRTNLDILSPMDLAHREVHVRRGSAYEQRLEALRASGIDVTIVAEDGVSTEELIRRVADREIALTVASGPIALLNRRYYPNAVPAVAISDPQPLGWAVAPNSPALVARINRFFEKIHKNGTFEQIYNRYFSNLDQFSYLDIRAFHRRLKTRLPRYRDIIRKAAKRYGFDWRLIAAQVYQESQFDPKAVSDAGAMGLMQLRQNTADSLGMSDVHDPTESIQAGVRHLKALYDLFDRAPPGDRMYIALAAYNAGQGHVQDAQSLARRLHLDPNRWASLRKTLPMLRFRKYYENTRYGYSRGTETVAYVRNIRIFYDILKRPEIRYGITPPPQSWRVSNRREPPQAARN